MVVVCVLGGEALDECGLRYLLAMRLHTCLLTSLPPLYRMQLLHQGKKKICPSFE